MHADITTLLSYSTTKMSSVCDLQFQIERTLSNDGKSGKSGSPIDSSYERSSTMFALTTGTQTPSKVKGSMVELQ